MPNREAKCQRMPENAKQSAEQLHPPRDSIPVGKEIYDAFRKTWIVGSYIASGSFGSVCLVADKTKPEDFNYVAKIEFKDSGGLFNEINCYKHIGEYAGFSNEGKDCAGMSKIYGFGIFEHGPSSYRVIILDRFAEDLQTKLEEAGGIFPLKTVCLVGISVISTLEYMHQHNFLHCDIKASNLLLGHEEGSENQIYVVDFGVARKCLVNEEHLFNIPDEITANAGTPIFMSRDAHRGCYSRRSDLEVLVFNLLEWLAGSLPWKDLEDYEKLLQVKERHMKNCDEFLDILFPESQCPDGISKLLHYVKDLPFEAKPDYDRCRIFLKDDLKSAGYDSDDLRLEFPKTKEVTLIGCKNYESV